MKWWHYGLSRVIYDAVSKYVNSNEKQKRREKIIEEVQAKYAEQHKKDQIILDHRKQKNKEKIEIVNKYLQESVAIDKVFALASEGIDNWFEKNYWQKTSSERRMMSPPNYSEIKLSLKDKNELINILELEEKDYIPNWYGDLSLESTVEYLIDNTDIINDLRQKLKKKHFRLYIATHYLKGISGPTTICFGLVLEDPSR